jgi:hypothetical protein
MSSRPPKDGANVLIFPTHGIANSNSLIKLAALSSAILPPHPHPHPPPPPADPWTKCCTSLENDIPAGTPGQRDSLQRGSCTVNPWK